MVTYMAKSCTRDNITIISQGLKQMLKFVSTSQSFLLRKFGNKYSSVTCIANWEFTLKITAVEVVS